MNFIQIILGGAAGFIVGYIVKKVIAKTQVESAENKAESILSSAKQKQKELLLETQEKSLKIIEDAKKDNEEQKREASHRQKRLEERETLFDQKLLNLEKENKKVQEQHSHLEKVKSEIQVIREDQIKKLEKISGLDQESAKKVIFEATEKQIKEELARRIMKLEEESSEEMDNKAKELISLAIQRCASSHAAETTTSMVNLPSNEMKGRIIGREGRNIRAIEQLTGVEIIVDDTPDAILVSGFSPVRRLIAKKTLEKLILDGRIHPAKIEETVEEAKKEVSLDIKKAADAAAYEVGIAGLDVKLMQVIGRLKYRTSYGQNVLRHSIEVANLSALLAEELGANVALAKKGGFLHDIGKAVDHDVQGTHPEIGKQIAEKFNMPKEICDIILLHHEDNLPTLECIIVKAADAISGARPGARKDSYENYIQRLDELEKIALGFEGVEKAYAIQAGREMRVFINPEKIDDLGAIKLAQGVAKKIEEELKYPGEIKVNVIRETRVIEYAR